MVATKIMRMRHAAKPSEDGSVVRVDEFGHPSKDELSVRGWQRAGALVRLFAPAIQSAVHSKRSKHTPPLSPRSCRSRSRPTSPKGKRALRLPRSASLEASSSCVGSTEPFRRSCAPSCGMPTQCLRSGPMIGSI
jgi:hypothetical protein